MDEIRALLQNLASLSPEDLEKLRGLIVTEFTTLDGEDTPDLALIDELATASDQVMAQAEQNAAEAAAAEETRAAARERIAKLAPPEEPETPEAEVAEEETEEAETPAAEEVAEEVAVAASGTTLRKMAAAQPKPKPSPEAAEPASPRTSLVAAGNEVRGVTPGTELDKMKLAEVMAETLTRKRSDVPAGPQGSRGRDVLIASANWGEQYPDSHRVTGEWEHDARIIREMLEPDALVATGGICAPVDVDWKVGMIATADRPVRDGLPSVSAGRGGLIFRPDLDFAVPAAATGLWTQATDLAPAGATKPVYTVACPGTTTVYVDAISTRLGFGNMQARFDPETVAANTDAAIAYAARFADNNLLTSIAAQCTAGVTTGTVLGATRDLLMAVGQCIAAFRNLHRVPAGQRLRGIFPAWVKDLLRIDLGREIGHAQTSDWNSLMITDAQIEALFDPYGLSPIWHIDGQSSSVAGGVAQTFAVQGASGAINLFPTKMVWYFYYEGAFQLLDGGRLDLGVVRDSLLDSTNDYETFVEIFEKIAYRGFTGGAIQLVSTLCANGQSAGTVNTTSSCA